MMIAKFVKVTRRQSPELCQTLPVPRRIAFAIVDAEFEKGQNEGALCPFATFPISYPFSKGRFNLIRTKVPPLCQV